MQRWNNRAEDDAELRLHVFKYGMMTGTTRGHLNEIASYVSESEGLFYTKNLCIVSQSKNRRFGEGGDSGSLVSLLYRPDDGKTHKPVVVGAGLLWGGCGSAWDITYAIPLEDVLEDVKEFLSGDRMKVDEVEFSNLKLFVPQG